MTYKVFRINLNKLEVVELIDDLTTVTPKTFENIPVNLGSIKQMKETIYQAELQYYSEAIFKGTQAFIANPSVVNERVLLDASSQFYKLLNGG